MAILLEKYVVTVVVVLVVAMKGTTQQQVPACASKLVPCANFLSSTSPPESCCGPLKEAVKDELPCLCSLFNSPDLLKAFNINLTQALQLPKSCGIHSDQSICSKSGSTPTTPLSSTTTPATGGGSSSKNENSGAFGGATWTGMPGLVSLLLLGWSIVVL